MLRTEPLPTTPAHCLWPLEPVRESGFHLLVYLSTCRVLTGAWHCSERGPGFNIPRLTSTPRDGGITPILQMRMLREGKVK